MGSRQQLIASRTELSRAGLLVRIASQDEPARYLNEPDGAESARYPTLGIGKRIWKELRTLNLQYILQNILSVHLRNSISIGSSFY